MSTVLTRVRGSVIAGTALFCVVEGTRLALSWPVPCEMMLEKARTDAEVVSALGGAPVMLDHEAVSQIEGNLSAGGPAQPAWP